MRSIQIMFKYLCDEIKLVHENKMYVGKTHMLLDVNNDVEISNLSMD